MNETEVATVTSLDLDRDGAEEAAAAWLACCALFGVAGAVEGLAIGGPGCCRKAAAVFDGALVVAAASLAVLCGVAALDARLPLEDADFRSLSVQAPVLIALAGLSFRAFLALRVLRADVAERGPPVKSADSAEPTRRFKDGRSEVTDAVVERWADGSLEQVTEVRVRKVDAVQRPVLAEMPPDTIRELSGSMRKTPEFAFAAVWLDVLGVVGEWMRAGSPRSEQATASFDDLFQSALQPVQTVLDDHPSTHAARAWLCMLLASSMGHPVIALLLLQRVTLGAHADLRSVAAESEPAASLATTVFLSHVSAACKPWGARGEPVDEVAEEEEEGRVNAAVDVLLRGVGGPRLGDDLGEQGQREPVAGIREEEDGPAGQLVATELLLSGAWAAADAAYAALQEPGERPQETKTEPGDNPTTESPQSSRRADGRPFDTARAVVARMYSLHYSIVLRGLTLTEWADEYRKPSFEDKPVSIPSADLELTTPRLGRMAFDDSYKIVSAPREYRGCTLTSISPVDHRGNYHVILRVSPAPPELDVAVASLLRGVRKEQNGASGGEPPLEFGSNYVRAGGYAGAHVTGGDGETVRLRCGWGGRRVELFFEDLKGGAVSFDERACTFTRVSGGCLSHGAGLRSGDVVMFSPGGCAWLDAESDEPSVFVVVCSLSGHPPFPSVSQQPLFPLLKALSWEHSVLCLHVCSTVDHSSGSVLQREPETGSCDFPFSSLERALGFVTSVPELPDPSKMCAIVICFAAGEYPRVDIPALHSPFAHVFDFSVGAVVLGDATCLASNVTISNLTLTGTLRVDSSCHEVTIANLHSLLPPRTRDLPPVAVFPTDFVSRRVRVQQAWVDRRLNAAEVFTGVLQAFSSVDDAGVRVAPSLRSGSGLAARGPPSVSLERAAAPVVSLAPSAARALALLLLPATFSVLLSLGASDDRLRSCGGVASVGGGPCIGLLPVLTAVVLSLGAHVAAAVVARRLLIFRVHLPFAQGGPCRHPHPAINGLAPAT
ncbi:hypothetical protein DIPPA_30331 [Diplonema papillatum]|nr:hypothetical protein DIPPA_30331 [Diplonema papillatum]